MSVNIATMGMFQDCCGKAVVGGGGAPPYRQEAQEQVMPLVLVKKLKVKDINILDDLLDKIKVTLVDD